MPLPQTFTSGAAGFSTKWSASSMHTLRFPWPAPSPRTAWPSMYAFWLMSSLAFTKVAVALHTREAKMMAAAFMFTEYVDENTILTGYEQKLRPDLSQ